MTTEEKIELLEELMELDEGDLTEDTLLEDVEEWDSLTKLSLMGEVKRKFGKKLAATEVANFKTVKDICDYLG